MKCFHLVMSDNSPESLIITWSYPRRRDIRYRSGISAYRYRLAARAIFSHGPPSLFRKTRYPFSVLKFILSCSTPRCQTCSWTAQDILPSLDYFDRSEGAVITYSQLSPLDCFFVEFALSKGGESGLLSINSRCSGLVNGLLALAMLLATHPRLIRANCYRL